LPGRGSEEEDRWVQAQGSSEPELLEALVRAALEAGRPRLAGRLVGLLPSDWGEDEDLARASRAARLILLEPAAQVDDLAEELRLLFEIRRRQRMRRAKGRSRKQVAPKDAGKPRRWKR
jgi:hypothetical protein